MNKLISTGLLSVTVLFTSSFSPLVFSQASVNGNTQQTHILSPQKAKSNNFTNSESRGETVCRAAGLDGIKNSCFPIFNDNSHAYIHYVLNDLEPGIERVIPPKLYSGGHEKGNHESTRITVTNAVTGKIIFGSKVVGGKVYNMKGIRLAMTYSHMGRPHTTIGDAAFHY